MFSKYTGLYRCCRYYFLWVCLCTCLVLHAKCQSVADTLRISLPDAEKQSLQNNLVLLAAKYAIRSNEALIEQARLWDNHTLSTDQNIYANGRFLEHSRDAKGQLQGQYFIQVQQLLKTAGKRSKCISLSLTNTQISLLEFIDYFDTYKDARLQEPNLKLQKLLAAENINYLVDKDILP